MNTQNLNDNRLYFVRWLAEDGGERQLNKVTADTVRSIEQDSHFVQWTMMKDWYSGKDV